MAPTTLLATQIAKKLAMFLSPYNISSALLLGSLGAKEKQSIKKQLADGALSIVVGTHALIQEDTKYQHLSYVIIDEQHRFGVEQREKLTEYMSKDIVREENGVHTEDKHGTFPHVLMMTATPIPRTLSMALYGNQDISLIREYPANRHPIVTKIITPAHTREMYLWIDAQIDQGRQVYWISPLVEESEKIDAVSIHQTAEKLRTIFPKRSIALLHGRMSAEEKERIMYDFSEGHYDIISSTSVVEVGVDNPNATVICIENAERF